VKANYSSKELRRKLLLYETQDSLLIDEDYKGSNILEIVFRTLKEILEE